MTIQATVWACEQRCGGPVEKLLLMTLADWSDQNGVCRVSRGKLADFVETTKGRLATAVSNLQAAGLVVAGDDFIAIGFALPEEVPGISPQRRRIYDRDGSACTYCGSTHNLTLDHVIPRSRKGSNRDDNLVAACRSCNCSKGARTPQEWKRK